MVLYTSHPADILGHVLGKLELVKFLVQVSSAMHLIMYSGEMLFKFFISFCLLFLHFLFVK